MDLSYNSTSVSLHLLINAIVQTNLPQANCFTILDNNHVLSNIPSLLQSTFVLNPPGCVPGCHSFILYDPISERNQRQIVACFELFFNYNFTSIIILEKDKLKSYNSKHLFARNAVFIQEASDYFEVIILNNWHMNDSFVVNKWDIKKNEFMDNNMHFFDLKQRNTTSWKLRTYLYEISYLPFRGWDANHNAIGVDYNIIVEFAKEWNMQVLRVLGRESVALALGYPLTTYSIDYKLQPTAIMTIKFMIPKPRIYIHWLQLFKVLPLKLWILVVATYCFSGFYFWLQKRLARTEPRIRTISIVGLMFLQGVNDTQMQTRLRARAVLAFLLIIATLYSSLFGSGIVETLISPSFANHIQTWEDLAKSGLDINCLRTSDHWPIDDISDYKSLVLSRCNYDSPYDDHTQALAVGETPARFSMAFELFKQKSPNVTILNLDAAQKYYGWGFHDPYTLFLAPSLNDFSIRCKEVGLDLKWEWDAYMKTNSMTFLLSYLDRSLPKTNTIKLNVEHVTGVFVIWICGVTFSVFIFIIELVQSDFYTHFI